MNSLKLTGTYSVQCHDKDGTLLWEDNFPNTITTVGKNLALDAVLSGTATSTSFMGLITSSGYSAISATDTMASHGNWTEASSYTGNRKTCAWSSASSGSKTLSAALTFTANTSDTIKGCFIVFGTGALATVSNTGGTLLSAGLFSGGDQPIVSTNILSVTFTLSG